MQPTKPATKGYTVRPQGADILDSIAAYFRRYLVADDHQLTILGLWSACSQCNQHFRVAPYLDIRSAEPHSGKSLCLNLLNAFSGAGEAGMFFSGVPAGSLIQRFLPGRSSNDIDPADSKAPLFKVLLDDCHHSFGPSERQPLLALLNSGSETVGFFPHGEDDYYFFGPKAFAGNNPLPRSLAVRCVPIVLRRPKPSEKFIRADNQPIWDAAQGLKQRLTNWLQQISDLLQQSARKDPANLPPTLSPGQRKIAEPLIHIADLAGGSWPAKVRAALAAVFDLADASPSLQMLCDVRSIFREKDNPEYFATADLLTELRAMESRPWSAWGPKSGRRIAFHLRPFGIGPRDLHYDSPTTFKGYRIADFQDAWERYLPPSAACVELDDCAASQRGNNAPRGLEMASATSSATEISAIGAD
jgi:Protein of unknown function (DUF3631)